MVRGILANLNGRVQLAYDNEGRLTAWQNIANVTTSPTSTPALEEALYDGEGWRIEQLDFGVRSREHDSSVSDQRNCPMPESVLARIGP